MSSGLLDRAPKFNAPWNDGVAAEVLRLVAVVEVEPGLQGMAPDDLRQADREVLGPVDVHEAREGLVEEAFRDAARRAADAAQQQRRQLQPVALEERHADGLSALYS